MELDSRSCVAGIVVVFVLIAVEHLVLLAVRRIPFRTSELNKINKNEGHERATCKAAAKDCVSNNFIHHWALKTGGNNVVMRQMQPSCHDLREFDRNTPLNREYLRAPMQCYGCNKLVFRNHPVYVFSCSACGIRFQKFRHASRDLSGNVAVVIGARTKLGHQVVVKLLDAGAQVIATTRYPNKALGLYERYPEWQQWSKLLNIYPESFDLDTKDLQAVTGKFAQWIPGGKIDILVICAAQTIRVREKRVQQDVAETMSSEVNRYQDARFVEEHQVNSWNMRLHDLVQEEMEEVYRVNAVAPCLLVQQLLPLLKNSSVSPHIVNVHAREGLFQVTKSDMHTHTNMAKAALAMFTKCLVGAKLRTHQGKLMNIHGCDPGWISVDEYYESNRPWIVPPLDEVDGAARILFPVMKQMNSSRKTRRHFGDLLY